MDDSPGLRALYTVSVNMGHHIVPHFFLPLLCHIVIDLVLMGLQLIDLFLRNRQSQFHLCLSESDPEFSPCTEFLVR